MSAREEIAGLPSAEAHAFVRQQRAERLLDLCDTLGSYVISSREAVWRGDNLEAGICLKRARLTLILAFGIYRLIAPNEAAAVLDRNGSETKTKAGTGGDQRKPKERGRSPDG